MTSLEFSLVGLTSQQKALGVPAKMQTQLQLILIKGGVHSRLLEKALAGCSAAQGMRGLRSSNTSQNPLSAWSLWNNTR